jgi:hypothetical protein
MKSIVKGNFEFRSTRNGTRVITRSMADFQSVKSHFEDNNVSYYSFYPRSEKPMKAVILHLPHNTLAKDISDGLLSLGFHITASSRWQPPVGHPPTDQQPKTSPSS